MKTFLLKLAMLVAFLLSVTFIWSAVSMVFEVSLYNFLLGILGVFFLLRGLEFADMINNLGPYSDDDEDNVGPGNTDTGPGDKNSGEETLPDEE